MFHRHRLLLLGASLGLLGLTACGSGSYSSSVGAFHGTSSNGSGGTVSAGFSGGSSLQGTSNVALATPTVSGTFAVAVGSSRTLSVTFTSSDGRPLTGLALSGTVLPAGWSGPANFNCSSANTGSGCVVNLTYAPTAVEQGTLTVNYVFIANSSQPQTGATISIAYAGTPTDNVVATASPSGQINAVVGRGSQAVSVNFTTDDGKAATQFALTTDLSTLPPGWTSSAPCPMSAIISTGSGCQVVLTYAPTVAASGVLTLAYTYLDASGTPGTGAINIPYAATSSNNVAATASPTGQVLAVQNTAGQAVLIAFTTDDGKPATNLDVTSNLAALPAGWSSASSTFSCASVGTGNGCLLPLTYAPTALTPGTLTLTYTYTDGSGAARSGLLNVAYAGTTNDVVIGTESPASQINAVITDGSQLGNGNQAVVVTFATGDGRPATALHLIGSTPAPAGWTYDASFACIGLDVDHVCQMPLTYAPTVAGSGTLLLNYSYINNAGEPKSGSVDIAYRATTNDNVGWVVNPAPLGVVRTGSSNLVTVTFTTDDGNLASGLSITSGLGTLPAGWSAAANAFTCDAVSTGAGCTLALTYAPTAADSGTLALGYSYLNNAGYPQTGTVTIAYGAHTPYLYVVNAGLSTISACGLNADDSVAACSATGSVAVGATAIALSSSYAYVTNPVANTVLRCALDSGGSLSSCTAAGGYGFTAPTYITVDPANTFAYITMSTGLAVCAISPTDGTLSACTTTGAAYDPLTGIAFSSDGSRAYSVQLSDPMDPPNSPTPIDVCSVGTGALTVCTQSTANDPHASAAVAINNGNLYLTTQTGLYACPVNVDASISSCQATAAGTNPAGLAFMDTTAYISNTSGLLACSVNVNGTLGACTTVNGSFSGSAGLALRR